MEKLNELVELAKKATPGKWTADWFDDERGYITWYIDLERQRSAFFLDGDGVQLNGTGNPSDFDKADCNFIAAAHPQVILEIAEAFRALEQRAEAAESDNRNYSELLSYHIDRQAKAEAKLAELEKQEAIATLYKDDRGNLFIHRCSDLQHGLTKVFAHPAPAIDLNAVRADAVDDVAKRLYGQGYNFEVLTRFAAQLRAGNAGKDGSHE